jgi:large-conductance mechanosensitive channel
MRDRMATPAPAVVEAPVVVEAPPVPADVALLTEIRDLLRSKA